MTRRLLLLAADPVGTRSLRLEAEARAIQQSLRGSTTYDIQKAWAPSAADLSQALSGYQPHIVHFSGGGDSREIAFADESGRLTLASADTLRALFGAYSKSVECVVLNSCYSAEQARAIVQYIRHVVGMPDTTDSTALDFAGAFYGALSRGKPIEFAYEFGRNSLMLASSSSDAFLHFPPVVEYVNLTSQILRLLAENSEQIGRLSPEAFELLICDRLDNMGFELVRVGSNAYQKDGGIDIIAWPRSSIVPLLMAVQVKHVTSSRRRLGSPPVREFLGALQVQGFHAGLLVTNTTFTPDARWVAKQHPLLLRLRDVEDLRRWLRDEHLRDLEWRDIPEEIELCPGVKVKLPR